MKHLILTTILIASCGVDPEAITEEQATELMQKGQGKDKEKKDKEKIVEKEVIVYESCTTERDEENGRAVFKCPDGTESYIEDGVDGSDGENGADGLAGAKGDQGEKGEKGDKGAAGSGVASGFVYDANDNNFGHLVSFDEEMMIIRVPGTDWTMVLDSKAPYSLRSRQIMFFDGPNCTGTPMIAMNTKYNFRLSTLVFRTSNENWYNTKGKALRGKAFKSVEYYHTGVCDNRTDTYSDIDTFMEVAPVDMSAYDGLFTIHPVAPGTSLFDNVQPTNAPFYFGE